jgi:hypothetical protein
MSELLAQILALLPHAFAVAAAMFITVCVCSLLGFRVVRGYRALTRDPDP